MVNISPVSCSGLLNMGNINGEGISSLRLWLHLCLGKRDMYKVRIDTWKVGTLIGRSRELIEVLMRRKVNIRCV